MVTADGVLFLDVGNDARSQMAEGLARAFAPRDLPIYSAGLNPAGVHPCAIRVMREIGIDISQYRSKSVADVPLEAISKIVRLCVESVPTPWPTGVRCWYVPFEDPDVGAGMNQEKLETFRRIRDQLRGILGCYFRRASLKASTHAES